MYKLDLKKKLVKCYIWITVLYGADTSTLRTIEKKYLESYEIGAGEICRSVLQRSRGR
jgi:hypothetical protein